eukprot:3755109-Pyramimonas_sp.AAC.1
MQGTVGQPSSRWRVGRPQIGARGGAQRGLCEGRSIRHGSIALPQTAVEEEREEDGERRKTRRREMTKHYAAIAKPLFNRRAHAGFRGQGP